MVEVTPEAATVVIFSIFFIKGLLMIFDHTD